MKVKIFISLISCIFLFCKNNSTNIKKIGLPRKLEKTTDNEEQGPQKIKKYLMEIIKDDFKLLSEEQKKFKYDSFDLNEDQKLEYIVFLQNSYYCGTGGCTYFLLSSEGKLITKFTVTTSPFFILNEKTNGWLDIGVNDKLEFKVLKFNGKSYPSNPSIVNKYDENIDEKKLKIMLKEPLIEYSL